MESAILMASGLGTRMRPLTETTPKPLIQVAGRPMIETVIEGLEKRKSINSIYIVVGYLKEQFEYLRDKYSNVQIIENKDYERVNNISSVYSALDVLRKGDCFICEADLVLLDNCLFTQNLEKSCYFAQKISGHTDDWVFDVGANGYISRVGKGGRDCYKMVGISFFKEKDAVTLAKAIEARYGSKGYEPLFWDDVVNENLDSLRLNIHEIKEGQLVEVDSVYELEKIRKAVKLSL